MDDNPPRPLTEQTRAGAPGAGGVVEAGGQEDPGPIGRGPGVGAGLTLVSAPAVPARNQGITVLVIEDDADVRNVIRAILTAYGHRVLVAADGAAGLDLYREHATQIRAVLTDLIMPGLQVTEVIAALRELNPAVRILAVSAMTDMKSLGITLEPGRLELLIKPMRGSELIQAIIKLLA